MAKTRNGVIAALDIGTNKVVCFVARVDGQGLRVVG
ncbi:MAG: Cell division protein FtsA, partial [Reyranella sp.]|nr:Cell division protein FtsA [Reyranella sp.]